MGTKLTSELVEFAGIFIGDGFANRYGNHYIIEFTGNSKNELGYFENKIIPLIQRNFKVKPHLRIVGSAIRLRYNSKKMFQDILKMGLLPGRKSSIIKIPKIFFMEEEITKSVIRGLMDSDGSVVWDRRKLYKKPYPRLSLTTISKKLGLQVKKFLVERGFSVYFVGYSPKNVKSKVYHIDLYGFEQLARWEKEIGFSNPKNICRINCPSSSAW